MSELSLCWRGGAWCWWSWLAPIAVVHWQPRLTLQNWAADSKHRERSCRITAPACQMVSMSDWVRVFLWKVHCPTAPFDTKKVSKEDSIISFWNLFSPVCYKLKTWWRHIWDGWWRGLWKDAINLNQQVRMWQKLRCWAYAAGFNVWKYKTWCESHLCYCSGAVLNRLYWHVT